jgi:surface polysaccharide O-acyltransferase-like enzyme
MLAAPVVLASLWVMLLFFAYSFRKLSARLGDTISRSLLDAPAYHSVPIANGF